MNKLLLSFLVIISIGGTSCSNKSPEDYGEEYCKCMKENNQNMKKCKSILDEAKDKFGAEDKEARKQFIDAYKKCSVKDN
jgi:hypothetical protein